MNFKSILGSTIQVNYNLRNALFGTSKLQLHLNTKGDEPFVTHKLDEDNIIPQDFMIITTN